MQSPKPCVPQKDELWKVYNNLKEMENTDFLIDRKTRKSISISMRTYSVAVGIFAMILGVIPIARNGFSISSAHSILHEVYILLGLLSIIRGANGLEFYKHRYRLKMDSESLKIKITFKDEIVINLSSITHLKTYPMRLDISFDDYIKTYDFSWMTLDEFEQLRIRISDYCVKKKIDLD